MSSEEIRIVPVGTKAPDFTTVADDGTRVSLASLRGQVVVLFFYPKDSTPTCTVEACEFRDAWPDFAGEDVVVFGVSPDSVASHQKFRQKHRFPFRLLADEDHAIATAYGVWAPKKLFGHAFLGIRRTTFVIDRSGVIREVFEKVRARGHAKAVLAAARG